ncbi:hypothetical protein K491DRAFT_677252 [Lophiostoma macrostomum CBS 122681]|uniref:CoA-dependent acyltransferase n=1 Tax=Lophiostoma macrostomum CBS 122681 TaxID=1314788 RepID=A0A6A6TFN6_9PLEO|nr:hypothetical protein K491DRAFT_677252 [Lophiostoma macrostomum CBS 122681]
MSQPNHPWVESSPGIYTQTHDSFQQFFSDWISGEKSSSRTTLIETSCIRIKPRSHSTPHAQYTEDRFEDFLRKAWISMRINNPGLAVDVSRHCHTYVVPSERSLEAIQGWLDETFLVHRDRSARDLIRSLDREHRPRLHWLPRSKELVLTVHHCFFDARGTWMFWDSFLKHVVAISSTIVNNEPSGVESSDTDNLTKLPPARDDLLGLPSYPTVQAWLKAYALVPPALQEDMVLLPPTRPPPTAIAPQDWPTGPSNFLRSSLSENQTAAVIAACKAKGISITAAFYAAFSSAARAIQTTNVEHQAESESKRGRYAVSFHHFDIRPWLESYHKHRVSLGLSSDDSVTASSSGRLLGVDYHSLVPFALNMLEPCSATDSSNTKPKERPFLELARDMTSFFQTTRAEFAQDATGLDATNYLIRAMFSPERPANSAPIFSSSGVAERYIRRVYDSSDGEEGDEGERNAKRGLVIEVEDIYTLTLGAKVMNAVMLHTFRNRIWVAATFDEEYFDSELFETLLGEAFRRLLDGLGIEE